MAKASLTSEQQMRVMHSLNLGMRRSELARSYGVSKDTIDRIWQKYGKTLYEPTTLGDRLAVLHSKLDRVLLETAGVGRLEE